MVVKKTDLVKIIASRAQSVDYWAFGHYLPNPDPVLKKMGKDISVYRQLLSDPHVGGCVRRRKAAIKGLEWRITTTNNEKVDEFLQQVFERLPLNRIITQILDATLFGYQALEVQWVFESGRWYPISVEGKPQEWFVFDEENQLRLRTKENAFDGILLPEKKFLLATQNATYVNPYGQGDLSLCFWAATFKKGGYKYWLDFVERYGSPWLVGKHPRQAKQNEVDELLDSLVDMLGTAVAAIPDDSSIEMLEAGGKGASSQVFDNFLRYCKAEIAIALLGQNQTTEADANKASATDGLEVTKDIRDDDARLVAECLTQLLAWVCELNFGRLEQQPAFELFEQESIDKVQAERDEVLHRIGVRFTKPYLERTYSFEEGDIELASERMPEALKPEGKKMVNGEQQPDVTPYGEPEAGVVVPDEEHPVQALTEQLGKRGDVILDDWMANVKAELMQAESLEAFHERLNALIPELSLSEYADLLNLANETAFMTGRYAVADEQKDNNA